MSRRMRHGLELIKETLRMAGEHDCLGQAKGAAFSTILFFFPLLMFVVALLVLTNWFTVVVQPIVDFLPRFLPDNSQSLVLDYVNSTASKDPTHLLVASFAIMLWTGWGLMSTFIEGVNRAYGVIEERTILKDKVAALQLLVFASLPVLSLGAIALLSARLETWASGHEQLASPWLWKLAKWGAMLLAVMAVSSIIYYFGVHRKQTWRDVLPGATLAAGIWCMSTLAFETYVLNFGRYDVVYGSLGAAIILFVWMYISSLAVLLGGEFNAVLSRARDVDRR